MSMESKKMNKDVAVVTGAGSGIGRAIAQKLAINAAIVACVDINQEALEETVDLIKHEGGIAFAVKVDVGDSTQVKNAMAKIFDRTGKISILINCAAIISYNHIEDCSDEEWDRLMNVNIGGYFYCLREVYPYMVKSGGGRIVQFSSSTALSGTAFAGPAYTASKSAVFGLTKYIAGYWAKDNIRANTICPGLTETSIVDVDGEVKDKDDHESKIPAGRIANPTDMADVVYFLVSDESRYMTGTTLHVNGGKYMYGI